MQCYRVITKDGAVRWVEDHKTSLLRDSEAVHGIDGVVFDISDRKEAEGAVEQSEGTLRAIFEGAMDGILVAEAETGEFVAGNKAICQMLGYNRDEILNFGVKDIHPAEDLPSVMEGFERQLKGEKSLLCDVPMKRKDGSVFAADINATSVELGGSACVVGVFRDTTERKAAEQALRESEERYRTMVDYTHDWEYWISPQNEVLYMSPSCERITGYSRQEFVADSGLLKRIIHPDDVAIFEEHRITESGIAEASPDMAEIEFRIITRSGEIHWLHHLCRPVCNGDGSYKGIRASNRNISKRKAAEQALQKAHTELEERVKQRTAELEVANNELRDAITELEAALDHVTRLQGLLPICMFCKRIRNDQDAWQAIELYISEHSEAVFSHSICQDCLSKHYPEQATSETLSLRKNSH